MANPHASTTEAVRGRNTSDLACPLVGRSLMEEFTCNHARFTHTHTLKEEGSLKQDYLGPSQQLVTEVVKLIFASPNLQTRPTAD